MNTNRYFLAFLIIGISIIGFFTPAESVLADDASNVDTPTPAELFEPIAESIKHNASLSLSASWNDVPLTDHATTSLPIGISGLLSWKYEPLASSSPLVLGSAAGPYPFSNVLSTADLTLDIYKGVIGSSTLLYSHTVASTSPAAFPFRFDSAGTYYVILSATYPDGAYPPGRSTADICKGTDGDFCVPARKYSLTDFQHAMTNGYVINEQTDGLMGNYLPAMYGILTLTIPEMPAAPAISNVLFIPGTLTSRLYMKNQSGTERDMWEPRSDLDVGPLAMGTDGKSLNTIYTRDLVDQLYSNDPIYGAAAKQALGSGVNVYAPFESFMNGLVTNGTIREWRSYPYDWRYDVSDIVKNGTLVGSATSTPHYVRLQDVIQELASTSPTGKVTIIAHSNGGLIAKALAIDLQRKGKIGSIDHIVMVGTPQFGTPKSLLDMLHGSEFTELGGLIMYSGSVRAAEETMPGPYDLLPSRRYFSDIGTPVASFDTKQPAVRYENIFGPIINSFSKLADFAEDRSHIDATVGLPGSTRTPIPLSASLLEKSDATHTAIDAWTPPSGISVTTIAGWGQLTPYEIAYSGSSGLNCDRTNFFVPVACSLQPQLQDTVLGTENGDDTVIAGSASGTATDTLYFDAKEYEQDKKNHVVHQSLLSASPIQSQLLDILRADPKKEPYVSATIPSEQQSSFTVVSAHSPVNLLATDHEGNQTGIVGIPGLTGMYFEKQDIPGSSIQVVDDEKYIYLPKDASYSITMQGYDAGATTLQISTMGTDGSMQTNETFSDIPTTASTTSSFTVGDGGVGPSSLSVDIDGTGTSTLIKATATSSSDDTYRGSLFTLRSLFASRRLSTTLKERIQKAFRDFESQQKPNLLAYTFLQEFVNQQSGVKLTLRQGNLMVELLHTLGL